MKGLPLSLELKTYYTSQNGKYIYLSDLPVVLKFTVGTGSLIDKITSDKNGNIQSIIQKLSEIQEYYQIKAELDIISFTGDDKIGKYHYSEYKGIRIPSTFIDIDVTPITIFLHSDEKSLGKTLNNPLVTPIVIKSLEKKIDAIFINEQNESDYILDIRIDTQKRGEAYAIFSSVAQISIYFKDGENILFANNFHDIKGTHTDYEKASREALKNLAERVEKEISDEIVKQILELSLIHI